MEERHFRTGQNFDDPSAMADIGKRYRALPGGIATVVAWGIFTLCARAIFDSWQLCGLVGLFGAGIWRLFVEIEKRALEQRRRDEITRAMIRELEAIVSHRFDMMDSRLDRLRDIALKEQERPPLL